MKRTKSMIYQESDESRELFLYSTNCAELYHSSIVPIVRNLAKKYSEGIFDKEKAIDAFIMPLKMAQSSIAKSFPLSRLIMSRFSALQIVLLVPWKWPIITWKILFEMICKSEKAF